MTSKPIARKLVTLWYPRNDQKRDAEQPQEIEIELMDVRAADSILVSYDFDRDGYVIKQASRFYWPAEDPVCDPDWKEVAFIKAWQREDLDYKENITGSRE